MKTLKTFDGQTAAFIAALIQNIPDLSGSEMQYLIGHPKEIKEYTAALAPTLRRFLSRYNDIGIELIELAPSWDFLIMQSDKYPSLGVAVSNRNKSLGQGLHLAFASSGDMFEPNGYELFVAPCGCCNWCYQLVDIFREQTNKEAVRLVRDCCAKNKITHLIFSCWQSTMKGVKGLKLIDPSRNDEMNTLNKEQFLRAFETLCGISKDNGVVSLETLF